MSWKVEGEGVREFTLLGSKVMMLRFKESREREEMREGESGEAPPGCSVAR